MKTYYSLLLTICLLIQATIGLAGDKLGETTSVTRLDYGKNDTNGEVRVNSIKFVGTFGNVIYTNIGAGTNTVWWVPMTFITNRENDASTKKLPWIIITNSETDIVISNIETREIFDCGLGHVEYPPPKMETLYRSVTVSNQFYIVAYTYDANGYCTVPLTYPPGKPHYSCKVQVYKAQQVGKEFDGTVIPDGGCYEDIPADMVAKALKQ